MVTEVISFRLAADDIQFLRKHGIEPADAARERVEGLLRSIRVGEALEDLRKHPMLRRFDAAKAVREAREDH